MVYRRSLAYEDRLLADYNGLLETVQKYDKAAFPIAYQTPLPKHRAFNDQTLWKTGIWRCR